MSVAQNQAANVAPPRRGAVLALGVDTTARAYDLQPLNLGGYTPNGANIRAEYAYLTLQAEGGDVYFYFANGAAAVDVDDVDPAAIIAAGGALAYANTYAARLVSDSSLDVRILRSQDKFLVVRATTGTPTLRFWASSEGF